MWSPSPERRWQREALVAWIVWFSLHVASLYLPMSGGLGDCMAESLISSAAQLGADLRAWPRSGRLPAWGRLGENGLLVGLELLLLGTPAAALLLRQWHWVLPLVLGAAAGGLAGCFVLFSPASSRGPTALVQDVWSRLGPGFALWFGSLWGAALLAALLEWRRRRLSGPPFTTTDVVDAQS